MRYRKVHNKNPFNNLEDKESTITVEVANKLGSLTKTALKLFLYMKEFSYKEEGIIYVDVKKAKFELNFKQDKSIYNAYGEMINSDLIAGKSEANEFFYNPKYF